MSYTPLEKKYLEGIRDATENYVQACQRQQVDSRDTLSTISMAAVSLLTTVCLSAGYVRKVHTGDDISVTAYDIINTLKSDVLDNVVKFDEENGHLPPEELKRKLNL